MPEQIADQVARLQAQGSWVPRAEVEALRAQLDEAEEKLTELGQGCYNLSREELIRRITAVGPARYRAGVYWQARDDKHRRAGMREVLEWISAEDFHHADLAVDRARERFGIATCESSANE